MPAQHTVRLIPWDDRAFVQAYERAAAELAAMGMSLEHAHAPIELERRLRRDGYPAATCYCERTVDLALAGRARCVVSRDGANAQLM
jgi:hypothetical protein